MWPYSGKKFFADVNRSRVLRGAPPGLSRWALNPMTRILIGDEQREIWDMGGGGHVKTEQRLEWHSRATSGPPAAGRGQEGRSSGTFRGHPAFGLPASRTVRERFSARFASSHRACGNWYSSYRWVTQRVFPSLRSPSQSLEDHLTSWRRNEPCLSSQHLKTTRK